MKIGTICRLFCGIAIAASVASGAACGGAVVDETSATGDAGASGDSGTLPHRTTDGGSDDVPGASHHDKRMFVSKEAYGATFGGYLGAARICRSEASDAGLTGDWNPYFCGGGFDGKNTIAPGTRYLLTNGTLVFEEDEAFLHGPQNPIDIDTENRVPAWIPDSAHIGLWTGCTFDGRSVPNASCNDFSDDRPNASALGGVGIATMWGGGAPIDCDQKAGILCIEQ